MKVALVYDRVNKWGGAERVLLALHEIFPDAPLYTSVYNSKTAPWAKVFPKIYTSFLQKIPFVKSSHELLGWLMPLAFESFSTIGGPAPGWDEYDLVISVTSEAAKGIITKPDTRHICYCLTPTRYLWSHYDLYFKNKIFRFLTKLFINYLRNWDKIAAQRPDEIMAISVEVQKRIKKYYKRDSEIIFPPVDLIKYQTSDIRHQTSGYYLVVSRLVLYKRVDLVIEVFNQLKWPLVIVGTGSEERKLKKAAHGNVKFTGFVSEDELAKYYWNAKALIMPQEEDFGIVSVEAQAAGVPVIAYKKGGALETVVESSTGVYFDKQTPESLINALKKFDKMAFNPGELIHYAKNFSKERFKREFVKLINE